MTNICNAQELKNAVQDMLDRYEAAIVSRERGNGHGASELDAQHAFEDAKALVFSELDALDGAVVPEPRAVRLLADFIKEIEREAMADGLHPEYAGFFNVCRLCTVTRGVTSRRGMAIQAGTVALYFPGTMRLLSGRDRTGVDAYIVWSSELGAIVAVSAASVRVHP